ncbi:MAG: thermonuclease family protein, partial [Candidatus Spechtbacterales bacterium]
PYATHSPLAERSVELFNRENSVRALSNDEKRWVAEGARDEDDPATRVINHFYDPVHNAGLSGFSSSKQWAHNSGAQNLNRFGGRDMTWETALEAYEAGNKELAYRILGHLLHLIQDATVPAHVRQDPHLHIEFGAVVLDGYGGKDPYERLSEPFSAPAISRLTLPRLGSFNAYLDAAAKYTNSGFLSMDSAGFYTNPQISRVDNDYIYTQDKSGEYRIAYIPQTTSTKLFSVPIKLKENNFSSPLVIADYWSRLAPVAIENGAGAIQLFRDTVREPTEPKAGLAANISSILDSVIDTASGMSARAGSSWEIIKFGWNRHAVDVASIAFALQTNSAPSANIQTYQNQRDAAARASFLVQLQNASVVVATREPPRPTGITIESTAVDEIREKPEEIVETPAVGEPVLVTRVIDGDTIELSDGRRVRYIGIDAPETGSTEGEGACFADEATKRNTQLVLNKEIQMTEGPDDMDTYGRLLRFVWVGNTLVNQSLIETGHAYAYDFGHPHEYSELFAQRQQVARDNKLGIWGPLCQEVEEELLPEEIPLAQKARIVINEVRMQELEFIELFNPTKEDVSLAGYYITYYASTRTS